MLAPVARPASADYSVLRERSRQQLESHLQFPTCRTHIVNRMRRPFSVDFLTVSHIVVAQVGTILAGHNSGR